MPRLESSTSCIHRKENLILSLSRDIWTTTYGYDYANRMDEVTLPGSSSPDIEYTYDADGVRVSMDDGTVTSYLVDKNRRFAQVLEEYDGSMDINVGYVYGDDLISMNRWDGTTPDPSYYLYDALGSTRGLTNDTGALTDTYDYDPFGTIVDETGSTDNDYLYTGEQYDPGVQFYYLRARFYNPSIGRFQNMDTWMGDPNRPVTLNKYLYGDANPVMFVDPSGYFSLLELSTTVSVSRGLSVVALFSAAAILRGDTPLETRKGQIVADELRAELKSLDMSFYLEVDNSILGFQFDGIDHAHSWRLATQARWGKGGEFAPGDYVDPELGSGSQLSPVLRDAENYLLAFKEVYYGECTLEAELSWIDIYDPARRLAAWFDGNRPSPSVVAPYSPTQRIWSKIGAHEAWEEMHH